MFFKTKGKVVILAEIIFPLTSMLTVLLFLRLESKYPIAIGLFIVIFKLISIHILLLVIGLKDFFVNLSY